MQLWATCVNLANLGNAWPGSPQVKCHLGRAVEPGAQVRPTPKAAGHVLLVASIAERHYSGCENSCMIPVEGVHFCLCVTQCLLQTVCKNQILRLHFCVRHKEKKQSVYILLWTTIMLQQGVWCLLKKEGECPVVMAAGKWTHISSVFCFWTAHTLVLGYG